MPISAHNRQRPLVFVAKLGPQTFLLLQDDHGPEADVLAYDRVSAMFKQQWAFELMLNLFGI